MPARVYSKEKVTTVKMKLCLRKMNSKNSTTVCSQNINKRNVNIADETLSDYSFLSRYHYTKSKKYL